MSPSTMVDEFQEFVRMIPGVDTQEKEQLLRNLRNLVSKGEDFSSAFEGPSKSAKRREKAKAKKALSLLLEAAVLLDEDVDALLLLF